MALQALQFTYLLIITAFQLDRSQFQLERTCVRLSSPHTRFELSDTHWLRFRYRCLVLWPGNAIIIIMIINELQSYAIIVFQEVCRAAGTLAVIFVQWRASPYTVVGTVPFSALFGTKAETVQTLSTVVDCSKRLRQRREGPVIAGAVLRPWNLQ